VKSSQVKCDQVDGGRLGVDFSLKSGHVSVPQRLAGLVGNPGCELVGCGLNQLTKGDAQYIRSKPSSENAVLREEDYTGND